MELIRWCLANWQDSQSKEDIVENWGHNFLRTRKEGWPNRQCASKGVTTPEQAIDLGICVSRMYRPPDSYP